MSKADKEKYKEIHVQQDFFQEIISGFSHSQQKVDKKAKLPNVMPAKQSYFFRTKTLPLIMKSVQKQGLLKDWFQLTFDRIQKEKQNTIKGQFLQAIQNIQKKQQQIQQQFNFQDQDKKQGALTKLKTAWKIYTKVKKILYAIKKGKMLGTQIYTTIKDKLGDVSSQTNYSEIEIKTNAMIYDKEQQIIHSLQTSVYPIIFELNQMIDSKLRTIMSDFFQWFLQKALLPNWDDKVDVVIWGLSLIAAYYTRGKSLGPSVVMRIGRMLMGFWTTRSVLRAVKKSIDDDDYDTAMVKAAGAKFKWLKYGYQVVDRGAKIIPAALDFYNFEENDVKTMEAGYRQRTKKWGKKAETALINQLEPLKDNAKWIEEVVNQATVDIDYGIRNLTENRGAMKGISHYYRTRIVVHDDEIIVKYKSSKNIYTLKEIKKILGNVGKRINKKLHEPFIKKTNEIRNRKISIINYSTIKQIFNKKLRVQSYLKLFDSEVSSKFIGKNTLQRGILKLRIDFLLNSLDNLLSERRGKVLFNHFLKQPIPEEIRQTAIQQLMKTTPDNTKSSKDEIIKQLKKVVGDSMTYKTTSNGLEIKIYQLQTEVMIIKCDFSTGKGEISYRTITQTVVNGTSVEDTFFVLKDGSNNTFVHFIDKDTGQSVLKPIENTTGVVNVSNNVSPWVKVNGNVNEEQFWMKVWENIPSDIMRTEVDVQKIAKLGYKQYGVDQWGIKIIGFKEDGTWAEIKDGFRCVPLDYKVVSGLCTDIIKNKNPQLPIEKIEEIQKQILIKQFEQSWKKSAYTASVRNASFFNIPKNLEYVGHSGAITFVGYNFILSDKFITNMKNALDKNNNSHYKEMVQKTYKAQTFFKYRYQGNKNSKVKLIFNGSYKLTGGQQQRYVGSFNFISEQPYDSSRCVGVWLDLKQLYKHKDNTYLWDYGVAIKSQNEIIIKNESDLNDKLKLILKTLEDKLGKL